MLNHHLFVDTTRLHELLWSLSAEIMASSGNLTTREAFVLAFLTRYGKGYGLQMVKKSKGLLKRGSVYVTLHRMQQKGYVRSKKETVPPDEKGPPRRHYTATAKGAQALDSWKLIKSSRIGAWFTTT